MDRMTAKEVAALLGFTTTNLKYYANLLEQNGMTIYRNAKNHREYSQQDVRTLQAMIYLNKEKSMLLEDAASFVTSSDTDINDILAQVNIANVPVPTQESDNSLSVLSVLSTLLQEQKALKLDLEKRDNEYLEAMKQANDRMIEQAQVLETLQKQLEDFKKEQLENSQKKGFWARMFS